MIIVRFAENDFCTIQITDLTEGHFFPRKWRVDNTHQNGSKPFKSKWRELHNAGSYVIINSLNITNVLDFTTEFTSRCGQQRWQLILSRKQYHPHPLLENDFSSTITCQFCLLIFSYHQPPYLQKSISPLFLCSASK